MEPSTQVLHSKSSAKMRSSRSLVVIRAFPNNNNLHANHATTLGIPLTQDAHCTEENKPSHSPGWLEFDAERVDAPNDR